MTRCAFLRGQTVVSCFVLCIAIASGKKGQPGRYFDTVQAPVAALQRSAHRDPTNKQSGRTLPIFQPKLSAQSQSQPVSLSGLDAIQAFLRPGNKEHHGVRRIQVACDSQSDTLDSCLPDDDCRGCYQGQFTSIYEDMIDGDITVCSVVEHMYCEVGTTCACGSECEVEAENYYQCILQDVACPNDANCADTTCEQELINLADCDKGIGNVCLACVIEAVQALADRVLCVDLQSTVCASSDSCGCGQCVDELELYYACLGCPDLSCTPDSTPTCDAEETTFYGCLDDNCDFCYERAIEAAINRTTLCGEFENELCAIPNTLCSSCGCEVEGLMYYQCIVESAGCNITVNCTDTTCDQEINAMASCFASQDSANPCSPCVGEAIDLLFANEDTTVSCQTFEDAICQAIYDTCGCGYCSEKVESWYACLSSDDCPSFVCTTPDQTPTSPPTPTTPPGPPTPPPTYSDPCYVCGDPNLTVDPSATVEIGNEVRKCGDVQAEYESSRLVSPFQCSIIVEAVIASCNCQSPKPPPSSRAPEDPSVATEEPQTDSSSAATEEPNTNSSGAAPQESKSNASLAALAALVAIPLLAVIVYLLIKRSKAYDGPEDKKAPISRAAPKDEFNETPPGTPFPNRHSARTPDSHYYQTDRSASPSSRSDEDYIYGHRSVAVAPAAFQNSGEEWSASYTVRSHEDHHDSVGEVSTGSGRSRDPSGVPAGVASCYASPVASFRSTGGYLPQQKDQCRKIRGEEVLPVAFCADEFEA